MTVPTTRTDRPRTGKRDAILAAALEVFGRDGYADASVAAIARVAGVAKPTVYNHFDDKNTLFGEAMRWGMAHANERTDGVIGAFDPSADDLRGELERVGEGIVGCLREPVGRNVMRLQWGERSRCPSLAEEGRRNRDRTIDRLAGKLARLSNAGRLCEVDPERAARQFLVLVVDDLPAISGFGEHAVPDAQLDAFVREGVDTFLAAFAPR
ncbi:TetR/AcrR family transcriptional regulator [Rhodococcus rhodnii]|uniref:HTH tetR-type domain-containing protein n=2 Tax=Rhodococcus rhodnii TaxID=38312 RepID=R7WKA1_9NOCA|nr:TetR/AcrR family transcriptional regulator [Rhodococcus rhodnii]EOM74424.1 hypothetical protein Rrhod_4226 [Rhodococcus rhodnii LMG 5362]TXG89133.1 TetR/AcrR family transcriptional regulator [Rhodococcus rhodnii]